MPTWIRCSARLLTLTVTCALGARAPAAQTRAQVTSPDGRNRVTVEIRDGALTYSVDRDGRAVFLPSRLGFAFQGAPPLRDSLRMVDTSRATVDETWTQPWGEVARVQDHHNELRTTVAEVTSPGRRFVVAFRAFNDGIGFRYELPAQPGLGEFAITDELTEFTLADDARAWWIPSNRPRLDRSEMLFSSSPPSVIENRSWIKPMKYVGIWWGMHIGTMTWSSGPKHGATTANTKRYIDFAAANGLGGVLVEGWNVGWDGDWIQNRNAFSFTKPYPDYDLAEVARYAHQKGVKLIVHNETSGGIENYERQMDSAFALYHSLGLDAIKSGYVTDFVGEGHSHYGQYMVRHDPQVIEKGAQYGIMLDVHEPIHDAGERRTYPNMMSREGARGQEYNAWSAEGGNPPEHETILFFTRMLDGPMDFTPGIFDILIERGTGRPRRPDEPRVRTTLAKQLALYVVLYSPLQMAADLPENYEHQPAFQFIRDVAVDWDTTRVIAGKIGDYVIVARRERNGPSWYLGAITDEEARTFDVPLTFLTPGRKYVAEIYADGPGANWLTNPLPVTISQRPVDPPSRLHLALAPGVGPAVLNQPPSYRRRRR